MAVWFDVTDLSIWENPQLTGIQRTIVNVLAELLTLRDDVRLFRYNLRSGDLEEVHGSTLPSAICQRVFGDEFEHLRKVQKKVQTPVRLGPVQTLPSTEPAARPIRQTVGLLIRRFGNEEILYALKDCWRDARRLSTAVRHKIRKPQPHNDVEEPLPPPLNADLLDKPLRPLFQENDVCLSLAATWTFTGYAETIARHRAATPFKHIIMIYDLIPTLFPQWVAPGFSRIITLWVRQQIANADLVLTISQFQKKEIETYIRKSALPLTPVRAIRLGDDPKLMPDSVPPLPRVVPNRPFVLCVSTLDVRKNQICLYQIWRRMAEEMGEGCPELVLVGLWHQHVADLLYQIRHDPLVNRLITHLRDVHDAELAWYYRNCLLTVYPSVYEGWGLPVGESLAHGKYCIASNAASLPEVGGSLVDYFDPLDFMECYRKVRRAIADPAYVRQKEELIRRTYQPVPWRATATQINAHVDALLADASPSNSTGSPEKEKAAVA